eukprot:scaffold44727_cov35-Tisochrysis_lutea.AAC.3
MVQWRVTMLATECLLVVKHASGDGVAHRLRASEDPSQISKNPLALDLPTRESTGPRQGGIGNTAISGSNWTEHAANADVQLWDSRVTRVFECREDPAVVAWSAGGLFADGSPLQATFPRASHHTR